MHADMVYKILRAVGWVVLAAMAGAIVYASFISIANWSGIGV